MTNEQHKMIRNLLDSLNIEDLCMVKALAEIKIFEIESETPEFADYVNSFASEAEKMAA